MLSDDRLAELINDFRFGTYVSSDEVSVYHALTELAEARKLLREALPHLHHTGATHHEQCACSVRRRIEALIREKLERKDAK